ncbi:hypothetical protein AB5J62_13035 [Amycolatopsis sp. cg5]|uniref:hypothetical protein n=1 Tax=Amycolatopsis sp. cg5 TaxID=3238802 RepID=UPI0035259355
MVAVFGIVAAIALPAVATAAPANEHCVYSATTKQLSCYQTLSAATASGRRMARTSGDVIAAVVFEHQNYGGASLTLTAPSPCVKNDKIDYWYPLSAAWQKKISSVQSWGSCWVWLYRQDNSREGPFIGNVPNVGRDIEDQAVLVGLS